MRVVLDQLMTLLTSVCRIQRLLSDSMPDPSMAGALPPGAWWENANSSNPQPAVQQPYGPDAGAHPPIPLHPWTASIVTIPSDPLHPRPSPQLVVLGKEEH